MQQVPACCSCRQLLKQRWGQQQLPRLGSLWRVQQQDAPGAEGGERRGGSCSWRGAVAWMRHGGCGGCIINLELLLVLLVVLRGWCLRLPLEALIC